MVILHVTRSLFSISGTDFCCRSFILNGQMGKVCSGTLRSAHVTNASHHDFDQGSGNASVA
jgi:hypothetical protein